VPRDRQSRRQHRTAAAVAAAAGLVLAACSSGGGSPGPVSSSPTVSASPSSSPSSSPSASTNGATGPLAPLTGLPTSSSVAARPAVALALAGPDPSGLSSADVVFQEISAPARYIAVYQSSQAGNVGPVTSTQPTDGQVLAVLHPLVGYDGAAEPYFITILDREKVTDVGYASHSSAYSTGPAGLVTSTSAISAAVHGDTAPPQLFRYRGASTGADTLAVSGVSRPTSVRVTIPGYGTEDWSFDAHSDRWQFTSGGPRVQVANLVVQSVSYKGIGLHHSVLSAVVTGTGRAEVFSGSAGGSGGGTAATGTWSKPHPYDVTNYLGPDGAPMAFQPGPTWVILAPAGTQVTTSGG
jgi:hypothetical protein